MSGRAARKSISERINDACGYDGDARSWSRRFRSDGRFKRRMDAMFQAIWWRNLNSMIYIASRIKTPVLLPINEEHVEGEEREPSE